MKECSDGEWMRYDDLLKDTRDRGPYDPAKGMFVLGVPIGVVARMIAEVHMYTGKTVEEWFKYVDERIVNAARTFVEYVPDLRFKKGKEPVIEIPAPNEDDIAHIANKSWSTICQTAHNLSPDAVRWVLHQWRDLMNGKDPRVAKIHRYLMDEKGFERSLASETAWKIVDLLDGKQ